MVVQDVQHSWKMKEQLVGISISVYLEKIDKLFMLQIILCGIDKYPVDMLNYNVKLS